MRATPATFVTEAPQFQKTTRSGTLWAGLSILVAAFAREIRLRRDMRRLGEMSDHMLKDIGLSPGQIEGAVRHGRPGALSGSMTTEGATPSMVTPLTSSWTEWR